MTLQLLSRYAGLPDRLFTPMQATPVAAPRLIAFNDALARELGLDPDALRPDAAEIFSGNRAPAVATPIAQLYAGHQFGGWNPQLGDGRALLLGEVETDGGLRDIQLKGSGPTPYSRGGDGRAWLGPVLREYVVSEAMAALGIPTTRALAAVATGEEVIRETPLPGAILTRVAASHIRVGTFQVLAARGDIDGLQALTDHVIQRHYPQANGPQALLEAVVAAQARLIADWMAVGFIHGVMNTDNCAVSGETIDYGPCAFMDVYHPDTVYSSIDRQGRYAYANQPQIAAWNLAQLATSLLPLMDDREAAIESFTEAVNGFATLYQAEWLNRFGRKIGISDASVDDLELVSGLLGMMAEAGADFTNTFRDLSSGTLLLDHANAAAWSRDWAARLSGNETLAQEIMKAANPSVIPRNHQIEAMITAATAGDFEPFHRLNAALARPFEEADTAYTLPPRPEEAVTATFCGT